MASQSHRGKWVKVQPNFIPPPPVLLKITDTYRRQKRGQHWFKPVCLLCGTQPMQVYCQLNNWEQISVEFVKYVSGLWRQVLPLYWMYDFAAWASVGVTARKQQGHTQQCKCFISIGLYSWRHYALKTLSALLVHSKRLTHLTSGQ